MFYPPGDGLAAPEAAVTNVGDGSISEVGALPERRTFLTAARVVIRGSRLRPVFLVRCRESDWDHT